MSRLEKVKNTFFKTPTHTGVTVASLALFTYTMNFTADCITGNCSKTPEEINAHLHLWQQFMNATVNATANTTTLVSTTLSAEQLFAEGALMATTAASFTGALSAGIHKLVSSFFRSKSGESPATTTEESNLLVNSTTSPTKSDGVKTKPNEIEDYSIPPHALLPTNTL